MRSASAKCRAVARSEGFAGADERVWFALRTPSAEFFPNDTAGQDRTMEFGNAMVLRPNLMKARLNVFIGTTKMLGPLLRRK